MYGTNEENFDFARDIIHLAETVGRETGESVAYGLIQEWDITLQRVVVNAAEYIVNRELRMTRVDAELDGTRAKLTNTLAKLEAAERSLSSYALTVERLVRQIEDQQTVEAARVKHAEQDKTTIENLSRDYNQLVASFDRHMQESINIHLQDERQLTGEKRLTAKLARLVTEQAAIINQYQDYTVPDLGDE